MADGARAGAGLSTKDRVIRMLRGLPDDLTFEDIQYHVFVLEKIESGLASAANEPRISQEEMEAEFRRWLVDEPD
jgi:hypothetical protein